MRARSRSSAGWRPRYYIGPVAQSVTGTQTIDVGEYGRFSVRRLEGTDLGLELLALESP